MKNFALLLEKLDSTNKTLQKLEALVQFFRENNDEDNLWAVAIFTGRRPKRPLSVTQIRLWAAEMAGIPDWLFEESYHVVGDLAETITLLVAQSNQEKTATLAFYMHEIIRMKDLDDTEKREILENAWTAMPYYEKFLFNKLLTGGFRIGISDQMVIKALSKFSGLDENIIAHRLSGNWTPQTTTFSALLVEKASEEDISKPYPFCLAYPLEQSMETLGEASSWAVEYKWDGIRGQLIYRKKQLFVWSRGEELMTDKFPEYQLFAPKLPDGIVLDGEILPFKDQIPMPFQALQTRIGRKKLSQKILEEVPVHFVAYDILEWNGKDVRHESYEQRRLWLEEIVKNTQHHGLKLSERITFDEWTEVEDWRSRAREAGAEGIMIKALHSDYKTGRKKGDWWKWKLEPMTIDAVLIYAMAGHGRRANLYTDYTFAVWHGEQLVPFTKAYSGLTDDEFVEVDRFIRKNTIEKFGPVRSVQPQLVFEIAFEGIQASSRHKSGIALRFPRMKRWRKDKPASEANTLDDLKSMLDSKG